MSAPLLLYDAARCPFCARTRITLAEKGVAYEAVEIDLADRPALLRELNPPDGRVPILELRDVDRPRLLPESAVIGEYLEDRFPDPSLWPGDPGQRAAGRLLVHRFDDFSRPYYALRRGEAGAREALDERLAALGDRLGAARWLSGGAFGLADIAYLPWLLRARDLLGVSLAPFPAVEGWVERACARPSVASEAEVVASL